MDNKFESGNLPAKTIGIAVKGMIEAVEKRMAAGEHVSAAPSNQAEAELLNHAKQENSESAERASE